MISVEEKLVYAATPFRMRVLREDICDFIERQGNFPVHPLLLLPVERYNYERHSRENIYRVCFGLVDICDELWIFGIGGRSLKEYLHAQESGKPTRSFVKVFDAEWEHYAAKNKYKIEYKEVAEEVLHNSITKNGS